MRSDPMNRWLDGRWRRVIAYWKGSRGLDERKRRQNGARRRARIHDAACIRIDELAGDARWRPPLLRQQLALQLFDRQKLRRRLIRVLLPLYLPPHDLLGVC